MSIEELNDTPVEKLEELHREKGYRFLICDGKILWYEEDER